ncbi:MAG TPA: HipA domain-containing protein [Candidatus Tumulicola sp.]|nr:HipA domain-containing protein [Candidatus Tumulicola sp.]
MRTLFVYLGDALAGRLLERSSGSAFIYEPDFSDRRIRLVLSQSLLDNLGRPLDGLSESEMVPFFANLIPEAGRFRRYVAASQGVNERDDWALLAVLGGNLPGAVYVNEAFDGAAVAESPEPHTPPDPKWRFSLAGVQMKFSANRSDEGQWTFASPERDGQWIVKLPTTELPDLVAQEYLIMNLARQCGLNVPQTELVDLTSVPDLDPGFLRAGTTGYAIRRFDRTVGGRIHQEDFCQILNRPPSQKYGTESGVGAERVLEVVKVLCGGDDTLEWLNRLAFTIAVGNGDAHLKNHAVVYPDGQNARLSPLYDVVCTLAYREYAQELALPLAGVSRFSEVSADTLGEFAIRAGVSRRIVRQCFSEMTSRLKEAWPRVRDRFEAERTREILAHRIENVMPALVGRQ